MNFYCWGLWSSPHPSPYPVNFPFESIEKNHPIFSLIVLTLYFQLKYLNLFYLWLSSSPQLNKYSRLFISKFSIFKKSLAPAIWPLGLIWVFILEVIAQSPLLVCYKPCLSTNKQLRQRMSIAPRKTSLDVPLFCQLCTSLWQSMCAS